MSTLPQLLTRASAIQAGEHTVVDVADILHGLIGHVQGLNETVKADIPDPIPPRTPSEYDGIEGFVRDLHCTVRECIDCGCLTPGGPTRCKRCVRDLDEPSDTPVFDPLPREVWGVIESWLVEHGMREHAGTIMHEALTNKVLGLVRESREVATRNAKDCAHLRRSAIELETERDNALSEAHATAKENQAMTEAIERLLSELAKPESVRLREVSDVMDGRAVIFVSLADRVAHELDELDEWIARAGRAEREHAEARANCIRMASELIWREDAINDLMTTGLARCQELEATIIRKHEDGYAWAQAWREARSAVDPLREDLRAARERIAELEAQYRCVDCEHVTKDRDEWQAKAERAESENASLRHLREGELKMRDELRAELEQCRKDLARTEADRKLAYESAANGCRVENELRAELTQLRNAHVTKADLDVLHGMLDDIRRADDAIAYARGVTARATGVPVVISSQGRVTVGEVVVYDARHADFAGNDKTVHADNLAERLMVAVRNHLMSAPSPAPAEPAHYTSTACRHDVHTDCRRSCKFCGEECRCDCHKTSETESDDSASSRSDATSRTPDAPERRAPLTREMAERRAGYFLDEEFKLEPSRYCQLRSKLTEILWRSGTSMTHVVEVQTDSSRWHVFLNGRRIESYYEGLAADETAEAIRTALACGTDPTAAIAQDQGERILAARLGGVRMCMLACVASLRAGGYSAGRLAEAIGYKVADLHGSGLQALANALFDAGKAEEVDAAIAKAREEALKEAGEACEAARIGDPFGWRRDIVQACVDRIRALSAPAAKGELR